METPRPLVSAQKGAHKTTNFQKTPRDGESQDWVKRKNGGGEQETSNLRHDPPLDRQGTGRRSRLEGGRSGSRNGRGRTEPRRENLQGLTGTLTTSSVSKGGQPDRVRGRKTGLQCKAEGANRDLGSRSRAVRQKAQGWAVEASGSGCLYIWKGGPRTE